MHSGTWRGLGLGLGLGVGLGVGLGLGVGPGLDGGLVQLDQCIHRAVTYLEGGHVRQEVVAWSGVRGWGWGWG